MEPLETQPSASREVGNSPSKQKGSNKKDRTRSSTKKDKELSDELPIAFSVEPEIIKEENEEEIPPPEILRCLVCYSFIDEDNIKSLVNYTTGKQMYKVLNVKLKKQDEQDMLAFKPPICPICCEIVDKVNEFLARLEELEKSMSELREQLLSKLMTSAEDPEAEDGMAFKNNTMLNVEMIRNDVLSSNKVITITCLLSLG